MSRPSFSRAISSCRTAFLALFILFPNARAGESTEDWISKNAAPLRTVETEGDLRDLEPIRKAIGSAKVVALGEPTHGAHEPLVFRNRLARFLAENAGFTAIAIETGFTEARAISRYVETGAGDLDAVVRDNLSWGFGNFAENRDLIRWMRERNADPKTSRKIAFYGFDLSGAANGAFPHARRAVDHALETLATADPSGAADLRAQSAPWLAKFSTSGYSTLLDSERKSIEADLLKLFSALHAKRDTLAPGDLQWAKQNITVASNLRLMFEASPREEWTGPGIPPKAFAAAEARDYGMSANVRWALEREGPEGGLLIFAHNNHVMREPLRGGIWSAYEKPPRTMGSFLRSSLGGDCFVVAQASGDKNESINVGLAKPNLPLYFLPLRSAPAGILTSSGSLAANHDTFVTLTPAKAFDAIIYLNKLSSAHPRQ